MQTVYIETSIVSYLVAKPSNQIIIAGHQLTTKDWWDNQSKFFRLVASELVIQEASAGDTIAANQRLDILNTIDILSTTQAAVDLAAMMINRGLVPPKAAQDALHIAIANTNGIDFLLTWNCKHIANAVTRPRIEKLCRSLGYEPTNICTPEELMQGESDG